MIQPNSSPAFSSEMLHLPACRIICGLAILAFSVFFICDPWVIESHQDLQRLSWWRIGIIGGITAIFYATFTEFGSRHRSWLSFAVVTWIGFGVVIVTELVGGASTNYWTMIMLTFCGAALVIPFTIWQAGGSFISVALFYVFWMVWNDGTGTEGDWLSSNTGIWLSLITSMLAVAFLSNVRTRYESQCRELERLNQELRAEIAERELAEEAFTRSQRLDAVGRLASGLAHELNNVLMVITGTAECIEFSPDRAVPFSHQIVESAQRGARMTSALLQFARKGSREDELFDMRTVARQVNEILKRSQRGRIELAFKDDVHACWVVGDSQLLSQALLNLALNGIDAMNGVGTLSLAIKRNLETIDVQVSDTGCGMPGDVLEKSFEPFFTTKAPGDGTGLGLSMAYGTIQDHHGELVLDSEPGRGTTASIRLPRNECEKGVVKHEEEEQAPVRIRATALLVDDDEMVRQTMKRCLENFGIQVDDADGGHQAIDKFSKLDQAYDLMIVDLAMPIIDGRETFHRIREINPKQPVLVYSGFAENESVSEMLECGGCRFLRKPFRLRELSDTIQSLITQADWGPVTSQQPNATEVKLTSD